MKPGCYTGGSAGENNPALRSSTSPGDFACWRTWRLLAAVGLPSPFRNTRCKASYEGEMVRTQMDSSLARQGFTICLLQVFVFAVCKVRDDGGAAVRCSDGWTHLLSLSVGN